MNLPDLVEIVPANAPVKVRVTVPGSKSLTNRALVLAALATGEVTLTGGLWSEDTQVMVAALAQLGIEVNVQPDPKETGNRQFTVQGRGGRLNPGGSRQHPMELFVENAGTAARFLSALVCLGEGFYRISGIDRMHERPQKELFEALKDLGYPLQDTDGKLPVLIEGKGPRPGATCEVGIEKSSQFASALMLSATRGQWTVKVRDSKSDEAPYVLMTEALIRDFPRDRGVWRIEPDASGGSYFYGAEVALNSRPQSKSSMVSVVDWPVSGWQVDAKYPGFMHLPEVVSRERDLGDSIMTAIVLAPLADHPVKFTDLGRLRLQECERVKALKTELQRCGARVEEEGDSLMIFPSKLHGGLVETYNDHRMAMCFATFGLAVEGIRIRHPSCVRKTFPNFFQKWSTPPPEGLGISILDERGQVIGRDQLSISFI